MMTQVEAEMFRTMLGPDLTRTTYVVEIIEDYDDEEYMRFHVGPWYNRATAEAWAAAFNEEARNRSARQYVARLFDCQGAGSQVANPVAWIESHKRPVIMEEA